MPPGGTTLPDPETDRRLMAAALRLGRRQLGRTGPHPSVGVLVVRDIAGAPVTVARAVTSEAAGAIAAALAAAGEAARGATLFVTIEPSVREADGTSEVDAIVRAGITRVVSALNQPDPAKAGAGLVRLREAGIEATGGVLGDEARRAHAGFLMRTVHGRPHVTLKLAVSADGMIGRKAGERMLVSGREAFERLQAMRSETDATLIGIETALVNDPKLTIRIDGLRDRGPIRVILDSRARLPADSALVRSVGEAPLLVLVGPDADKGAVGALRSAGAEVIEVAAGTGGLDIQASLSALAERGIALVLAEGGARVASTLVGQGLADAVVLFRAPVVVGPDGVRALAGGALSAIERSPRYRIAEEARLGEDRMLRYERTG